MNWRALLAGGVFVALLIAAVLIARPDDARLEKDPDPVPELAPPPIAAPRPPLTRADLIDAAARAADAHARALPVPAEDNILAGRRFSLRLPFGCTGPAAADGQASMSWSYDEEEQTLRVSVAPHIWTDAEPVRTAASGMEYEAAEGFWIERPWLQSGDCPSPPQRVPSAEKARNADESKQMLPTRPKEAAERATATEARGTLALVELFAVGSRRAVRRNGRPYSIVTKIAPGEIDLSRGLRLVLTGRLKSFAGHSPIACSGAGVNERPLCLIRAEIDRVAITDASGQRLLGEWRP